MDVKYNRSLGQIQRVSFGKTLIKILKFAVHGETSSISWAYRAVHAKQIGIIIFYYILV